MIDAAGGFRRAQLATGALFGLLGFQYATWATRLPAIKSELGLTPAQIGVLLLATGIGAVAAFPAVAVLMRRLGSRRLAIVSCAVLMVALAGLAALPGYPGALVIMLVDGVAVACLNVAMNAQGTALEVRYERSTMAKLHAVFSGGTFLAALLATAVTAATSSLVVHFGLAIAVMVALTAFARGGLPADDLPDAAPKEKKRWALPNRTTLWLGAAMVFGTVTEGAMNDWSALYLEDVVDAAPELVPLGVATVSAMMLLARLFADGWRARWGDRRVVLVGAALAFSGLTVALVLGGLVPALLGFACVGLGMAAVTPSLYVAAAKAGTNALALVATMGTTGLLVGPPVIGFVANASGMVWGMGAVALSAFLVTLCVTPIRMDAVPAGSTSS